MANDPVRCRWVSGSTDPLMLAYHDTEWGKPSHDDRHLFEMLTLEGAQAGLSWSTILNKREGYRRAFAGFDPVVVKDFDETDIERLLLDSGIVRNRLKVESTVSNAGAIATVRKEFGTFDAFVWELVVGAPIVNRPRGLEDIPSETDESRVMSKELKRRGFRFVGPTICYAFMQATGMVNDHSVDCFRYSEV
jgi:DNA-3-methyladenine glycosylase I